MSPELPTLNAALSPARCRLSALWMLVLALLLAGLPPPAAAQWTWRDKTGQVNASDRPPPKDVPEKDILSRPTPEQRPRAAAPTQPTSAVAAPASAPPTALEREVQARKRATEEAQATKAKAEEEVLAAKRAENCRAARNQLMTLESGQRIARTNDKGEREILDDPGRAEEERRTRAAIASECR